VNELVSFSELRKSSALQSDPTKWDRDRVPLQKQRNGLSADPLGRIIIILKMKIFIPLFIILILFSGCSSIQVLPDYGKIENVLTKIKTTSRFTYYMSIDDSVQIERNDAFCSWLLNKLKIELDGRIIYYKYKDTNQKYQLMGSNGNALVIDNRIHTILDYDNHELVHVLVGQYYGNPPKLFGEGIAVAHQVNPMVGDYVPKWGRRPIDSIALDYNLKSQIPSIDSLLSFNQFFHYPENITYPISGSYVKYLLSSFGYNVFLLFAKECNWTCTISETKKIFKKVYQKDIEVTWNDWKNNLNKKIDP